jgi:hypothetical protein
MIRNEILCCDHCEEGIKRNRYKKCYFCEATICELCNDGACPECGAEFEQ